MDKGNLAIRSPPSGKLRDRLASFSGVYFPPARCSLCADMTLKQIQAIVDACLREPAERDGYPCERKSEPEARRALKDFAEANPYPGEAFYWLAYDFYDEVGTVADQCNILDRWKRAKGEPWAKRAESRRKFWKHWQDTELTKLSDEQRRKRMAEGVARRR